MNAEHDEVTLAAAGYRAVVTRHGAALRSLLHADRPLVVDPAPGPGPTRYQGAVCAPWPNRVVDATWTRAGQEHRLAVTEPERGHALHGFVHDAPWAWSRVDPTSAELVLETPAQPGYPWPLALTCRYEVADSGLRWTLSARVADPGVLADLGPAPYGATFHPYLVAGAGPVDRWSLRAPVTSMLTTAGPRMLPGPPTQAPAELTTPGRPLGELRLDHAFAVDAPGSATLVGSDGRGVRLDWGTELRWLQAFTADWPDDPAARTAVALEPMSCPPDAFNSGTDLIALSTEPVALTCTLSAVGPD